ncbi:MAG TPA: MauE/DoxX family redox-associated membrane protein, partial [Flavisolibacter sp.]
MKIAVRIIQIFVGVLFIISGLVKANDPIGLSYKMQEFFELWSEGSAQGSVIRNGLDFFHRHSLTLSIGMIALEIVAGVALLIAWKKRFILWMLLVLIVFFTILTGYAYLSGKFTNCGCFGDCLPITPLTSFIKDIVLLLMILFLLIGQRYIQPLFRSRVQIAILSLSLVLSLGLQWYVLNYLPIADCLPFKKGNNIAEQMKPPPGSRPDSVVI